MDFRSDRPSARAGNSRVLSSFPHQRLSQISPYASPVVETAGPSQASAYHSELALDESSRAHRTTALRQLNRCSKPLTRKSRQAGQTGGRSSTLASQPVLVRSYSGHADDSAKSKMPSRRRFSFGGSSKHKNRGPELPSPEDFSIEGILRVIEPDIRGTLDSIAEICGRSKLSLANEYGSHIAPLGEIRAPPGGLVTVEEASPSHESQVEDNVVIYDEDNCFMDGRVHHQHPYSYYDYFDVRRTGPMGHEAGYQTIPEDGLSGQAQPDTPRLMVDLNYGLYPLPLSKEFVSRPNSHYRALLGKTLDSASDHAKNIQTPAVVSEVYIIARANEAPLSTAELSNTGGSAADNTENHDGTPRPAKLSALANLYTFFNRFKQGSPDSESSSGEWQSAEMRLGEAPEQQTAVMRLRQVLERQASRNISQAA